MMQRFMCAIGMAMLPLSGPLSHGSAAPQVGDQLILDLRPYDASVEAGLPMVLRVTLENISDEPVPIYFKRGDDLAAPDVLTLYARDVDGAVHTLTTLSVLLSNIARVPAATLRPDHKMITDYATPLYWLPPTERPESNNQPQPIPPGEYTIYGTLLAPQAITSVPFDLTVRPPKHDDIEAHEMLEALPYYVHGACRWPGPDDHWTCGGDPRQVSDQLRRITQELSNSRSAEWLHYWSILHRGSDEEALAYVRQHPDFPLSDNLMFRVISRIADDDARHDRAVELLAELQRLFPSGDTAPRAETLRQKLSNKRTP